MYALSDLSDLTTGRSQTPHVVEEGIEMLRAVLPDTMIIAALDIIDREGGEQWFSVRYRFCS